MPRPQSAPEPPPRARVEPHDVIDQPIEVAASEGLPARGVEVRVLRRWESGGHADADYQDRLSGRLRPARFSSALPPTTRHKQGMIA